MDFEFKVLKITRENVLKSLEGLTIQQLNLIPTGFNNNLIWNFGHIVVTQQLLTYGLSGLPIHLPPTLIDQYRKGSKPNDFVTVAEFELLQKAAFELIETTKNDYETGVFKGYKAYTTSFNITLQSIEEGIKFNNTHEGLHFGAILALRKFV